MTWLCRYPNLEVTGADVTSGGTQDGPTYVKWHVVSSTLRTAAVGWKIYMWKLILAWAVASYIRMVPVSCLECLKMVDRQSYPKCIHDKQRPLLQSPCHAVVTGTEAAVLGFNRRGRKSHGGGRKLGLARSWSG